MNVAAPENKNYAKAAKTMLAVSALIIVSFDTNQ
jgi:hypothetical protein